ncbi:hypothetical protein Tco_1075047 [Tanacetum coccineum]
MLAPSSGGRKAHLLKDKQIPSVGTWMTFGGNTRNLGSFGEETDKITDLHQIHEEVLFTERGDGVAGIKRRRRDLSSDGVRDLATTSGRGRLKEDLESSMDDDIHSQRNDGHQEDDAPPEGEIIVEEIVINEDEVILKDETPELITELQNVNKHVPTIFDHARIEATLNDMLSNQFKNAEENPNEPPRYLFNKDLFFLKNRNIKEKKYILSLHKIHAERFPKDDLEEKMNRWVRKEMKTHNFQFNIGKIHGIKECTSKIKDESETIQEDNFSNNRITEVVKRTTDQPHGLDFMEQIIVMRENDKPDIFFVAYFKYLNKK